MSKDRKMIAVGVPRNRKIILVDDLISEKSKNRILTYKAEARAKSAMTVSGFYTHNVHIFVKENYSIMTPCWQSVKHLFEPVKVSISIEEIE